MPRVHNRCRCRRRIKHHRSRTQCRTYPQLQNLPSINLRTLWQSRGSATERKRPLSSIQPLCSSQALWILGHQRISRCLQHVLLQWHPLQSLKRTSWRNLCNTQNHPCSSTYCTRLARQTLPWQPRLIMRLGLCQRLCRVHVAHPSSPKTRRLCHRNRCTT